MSTVEAFIWLSVAVVTAAAVAFIAVPAADVSVSEAWSAFATSVP